MAGLRVRVHVAALGLLMLALSAQQLGAAVTKLPHYITACSYSDPKLDECVVKSGRHAIPFVINGDPKYRVPNLNPLLIPELNLQQGSNAVGLKFSWKNAQIHGLKGADFREAKMDVKKQHLTMKFFLPTVSITGTYTASGRILLLPITGTGPSNITVQNMKVTYDIDWVVTKRANGKEYLDVLNPKMTLDDLSFLIVKFENLFNGDKLLGSNMNQFLNENWKEIAKELGPGVADAIGQVFGLVLKNICDIVPYNLVIKP